MVGVAVRVFFGGGEGVSCCDSSYPGEGFFLFCFFVCFVLFSTR